MPLTRARVAVPSIKTSFGTGRYQSGESDQIVTPRVFQSSQRGVLYCHGAGSTAASPLAPVNNGEYQLVWGVGTVYPLVAPDLGGTFTWGNATAQTRAETARGYLGTTVGATNAKVHLIGASMGALTALQYAKANPTKVQSIALVIPAIDLDYAYQNNVAGNQASIGTAWSVTFPTALPAAAKILNDSSYGIPIKMWYVTDDIYTPTASSTTFATNQSATAVSLGALGHTETAIAAVPPADVISFFQSAG